MTIYCAIFTCFQLKRLCLIQLLDQCISDDIYSLYTGQMIQLWSECCNQWRRKRTTESLCLWSTDKEYGVVLFMLWRFYLALASRSDNVNFFSTTRRIKFRPELAHWCIIYTTSQWNFKNCLGGKNFPLNNMVIKTNISNVDQLQLFRDLQSNERQLLGAFDNKRKPVESLK